MIDAMNTHWNFQEFLILEFSKGAVCHLFSAEVLDKINRDCHVDDALHYTYLDQSAYETTVLERADEFQGAQVTTEETCGNCYSSISNIYDYKENTSSSSSVALKAALRKSFPGLDKADFSRVDLKATEQDLTGDVLFTALVEPPRNYNFRFKENEIYQKEGDLLRPKTKDQLKARGRWLDWEEIVAACGKQRDFCELVEGDRNRERQYCNLLILCLYSFIPPSCGLEIRTLKICHDWQSFNQKDYKARNVLLIKGSEQVTLHFDSYKTVKWMGHQELTLKGEHELCRIILDFVNNHRGLLVTKKSGNTHNKKRTAMQFQLLPNLWQKLPSMQSASTYLKLTKPESTGQK
ncbi:uncharacterized protein LOC144652407 [Oculina patagonica]